MTIERDDEASSLSAETGVKPNAAARDDGALSDDVLRDVSGGCFMPAEPRDASVVTIERFIQ